MNMHSPEMTRTPTCPEFSMGTVPAVIFVGAQVAMESAPYIQVVVRLGFQALHEEGSSQQFIKESMKFCYIQQDLVE